MKREKVKAAQLIFTAIGLSLLLAACAFPGSVKPVIKVGLVAPFEGEFRHDGYQRLYGVKLALQEANLNGGVAGYKIELVALNDNADTAQTILQAQALMIDSDVKAVIGPWEAPFFDAVAPVYRATQLPVIDPTQFTDFLTLPPAFATDFKALGGSEPDTQAKQAYLVTVYLLQSIEKAAQQAGNPERAAIMQTLTQTDTP